MKRSLLMLAALSCAVFGALLAIDVIDFETDRIDRWVMIFAFAIAVSLVGLITADASTTDQNDAAATGRAAAARKLNEGRPDPADLPSKPGSLLRQQQAATSQVSTNDTEHLAGRPAELEAEPVDLETEPAELEAEPVEANAEPVEAPDLGLEAPVAEIAEPIVEAPTVEEPAPSAVVPVVEPATIDPVDAELHELIDEDQMHEITALVEASDDADTHDTDAHGDLVAGGDSVEPLARLELRLADYDDEDLQRVVKESEAVVISEMVRTGQLSSEGELTEKDIASMVFLAYTSEEMLTELRLRKSLDQPTVGIDATTGSDLAPLRNIE